MITQKDLRSWFVEGTRILKKFAAAPLNTVSLPPEWSWREALGVLWVLSCLSGFFGAVVGTGVMLQMMSPYDISDLSQVTKIPVWSHILSFQVSFILGVVLWAFGAAGGVTCGLFAWMQARAENEEGEDGASQHLEYLPLFRRVVVALIPVLLSNLVGAIVPVVGVLAYVAMGYLLYRSVIRKNQPTPEATSGTGVSH